MTETVVRRICACDEDGLAELFALEVECFGTEAWSRDSIRGFIENTAVVTVAAFADGAIVGSASAITVCDEAEITKVAVTDTYRRRGLATLMLAELERLLRGSGVCRLLLEVRAGNLAARALYGSLGFTEYGERRGYYQSPREDAVLMEKRLSDA